MTDLEIVKNNGLDLEFIKYQTPEICLEAVRQNGFALQFVKQKTDEIIIEAVSEDINAIKCIKKPTDRIYNILLKKLILKQTDESNLYVKNQMIELLQWLIKFLDNPIVFDNEELKEIRTKVECINHFYSGK